MLAVRVTGAIRDAIVEAAHCDGLDVSEWLRSLIVGELRRRGALPKLNSSNVNGEGNIVD